MRVHLLAVGLAMVMCGGAQAGGTSDDNGDSHTTVVRDANGTTVITQSGDPDRAVVRIEKTPGRTTVYRRSGGNTAIVTTSTGVSPIPPEDVPEWINKLLNR